MSQASHCPWCTALGEPHEAHAVAQQYFAMVAQLDAAGERTEELEAELAHQRNDVLLLHRFGYWGVVRGYSRKLWASELTTGWDGFHAMLGIHAPKPPWATVVDTALRQRASTTEARDAQRRAHMRQERADIYKGEM